MRCLQILGILMVALAGSLAGGCSTAKDPTFTVAAVSVTEESPEGMVVTVALVCRNDNEVSLPLRKIEYQLDLGGRRVFAGFRSPESTLRPMGEQLVTLPIAIPLTDTAGNRLERPTGEQPYRIDAQLTYLSPGALAEVLFDTGFRRPVAKYTGSGRVDFGAGPGSPVKLIKPDPAAGS